MKKRILSVVLVLSMMVSFMPIIASAATSGTCGDNLTWTLDDNGTLTISGTGEMKNYTENQYTHKCNAPWYSESKSIKSVVIEKGVTNIGDYAFDYCKSLTNITIPNSVTSIGEWAFLSCSSLTSMTIPNSVTSIGGAAFTHCRSLTSITIPNSITSIDGFTFNDCDSLTSITIPNSVTSIGRNAFWNCSSLTNITIPNSVTNIGDGAFSNCSSLTSITIPNSVISIGEWAFCNCTNLKDVYYTGTKAEWKKMDIDNNGNDDLLNATIHYNSTTPSTIYSADKVSTQITSGKLKITLNVDDNINNATVYVAFRNKGKIVDVKKATLSNLKAEVSLSNKTYTDMNIYIWNSRQQPFTYVKNIKK